MNRTALSFALALAALSSVAHADDSAARRGGAQNGGEQVAAQPAYASGLNGRPKAAVRPNVAQNSGDAAIAAPTYAAGLNGRVAPAKLLPADDQNRPATLAQNR